MASTSKVKAEELEGLMCPVCMDVLKNPTLLSCGHTFCKGCLVACDTQRYYGNSIRCPVCRKTTKLGINRIAGLTPNFLAQGIQDELNVVLASQSFCPLHSQVHSDIFCEVCKKFICLTCYFDNHKDHNIKKKEEVEGELRKKRDFLIQKGEERKTQIEKCVNNAEQQRIDIHCFLSDVEKEVKDEYAKRVTILQKDEETLLRKLDYIRKDTENQLQFHIANYRQFIDRMNRSITSLRSYTCRNVDPDTIKGLDLQCSDVEKSLEKNIDEETMVHLKQTAESTRFRPSDENLLALGYVEINVKQTSNIKRMKTAAGAYKEAEQVESSRNVSVIPALVKHKLLNMVRKVDASHPIWGISALSQDAVVVGYGRDRLGSDCFSVSGDKTRYLTSKVGAVWDIAVLTDGRSVVSHAWGIFSVYSSQDRLTPCKSMPYTCKDGGYAALCVDQHDNIYAVTSCPQIYIFHGSNPDPQRVVPTGNIKPEQICVTKTGVMVTSTGISTPSTVTVFEKDGYVGSSITANDDELLYAAVDSQDRVLVARVRYGSDVFRLTRYTLHGTTLIEQVSFEELKLLCGSEMMFPCCYMASLAPRLIALANSTHMYFIRLPE